jgi:hypothetical protein
VINPFPTCPGCGALIQDGECGGEGEGICLPTIYALDSLTDPVGAAAAWADFTEDPLPSAEEVAVLRTVWGRMGLPQ